MRLELKFDPSFRDSAVLQQLQNRLYMIRTLVPPGFEELFRERAVYVNAHSTTAIEGNPLSADEALRVSMEGPDRSNPAEVEVANIEAAYDLIHQLAGDPTVQVDQGLMRTVNSLVLKGLPDDAARARGRYRLGPSAIRGEASGQIHYLPPRPETVPVLMAGLEEDIARWRAEQPAAITAALAHFGLVSIHPFEDGNGRTARLLAHMLLEHEGGTVERMLTVNEAILAERDRYYQTLRETQGPEFREVVNVDAFLEFHTSALLRAAIGLEEQAVAFNQQRDALLAQTRGALNERQVTALMFMVAIGRPLASSAYATVAKASQSTAVADLRDLVEKGILGKRGRGRNTRYELVAQSAPGH